MFCETCHWYTRGEEICPHCGAPQSPAENTDRIDLSEDVSVEASVRTEPLAQPAVSEPQTPSPLPAVPPAAAASAAPNAPSVPRGASGRFCSSCGTMEYIGAKYCAKCGRQLPSSKPAPGPPSVPKPVPYGPRSAVSRPNRNKQSLAALAVVLVGVILLMLVLIFAGIARESALYSDHPVYDDFYAYEITEPALEEAQVGDVILFGDAQWSVLDTNAYEALLLLHYEVYLRADEVYGYLNDSEDYGYTVWLGGVNFTAEEYARIQPTSDGSGMFLLSEEEREQYGVPPPGNQDEELVGVCPAIRVNLW